MHTSRHLRFFIPTLLAMSLAAAVCAQTMLLTRAAAPANASSTQTAISAHDIAASCLTYATDHNDQMPDDLARLVAAGMLSPKQLVSGRSKTKMLEMTPDLERLAKDDFAKFSVQVSIHCDFIYIGKKKAADFKEAGNVILAYERPTDTATGGIVAVFLDGHAEVIWWTDIKDSFKATNDYLRKNGLPVVDVESLVPPEKPPQVTDSPIVPSQTSANKTSAGPGR